MSKKPRKSSNRPRQRNGEAVRPGTGGTAHQLAGVGPAVGQPGYLAPDELLGWLAQFEGRHQHLPAAGQVTAGRSDDPHLEPKTIPGFNRLGEIRQHLTHTLEWLQASHQLIYRDAEDPDALFDTAGLRKSVMHLFDHVQTHIRALEAALGIVVRAEPLATTHRNGSRWGGKLSPTEVLWLAQAAASAGPAASSVSYLAGRADHVLAEATSLECDGGPAGKDCRGTRVRLADGTRASSCWAHLSTEQKAVIRAEREAALQRPCPLCQAPTGQSCVDYEGEKATIHSHRLRPGDLSTDSSRRTA